MFHSMTNTNTLIGNHIKCYSSYAIDAKIRYNAASGGVITALLVFALKTGLIDGALVTKEKEENPFIAESFIARTKEDIIKSAKSKYCPVSINPALKEIVNSKDKEKFAIVGLPCHISSIRKVCKIDSNLNKKILFTLGLFCDHTPSLNAIDFFLKKFKIKKEEVVKINYRGDGWPGYVKIFKKNGEIMKYRYPLYWSIAGSNFFYPKTCLACQDCSAETSDISFGDAWLPEFKQEGIGRSLVICRTERGEAILREAQKRGWIKLEPIPLEKIIFSLMGTLYLKKKGLRFFFPAPSNQIKKPGFLDGLVCLPFFINVILGRQVFFRKILLFVPLKFILLYSSFLSIIYRKKAKRDFKKYIK
jgi:coenzyme F420 hydrogenase subunit beta